MSANAKPLALLQASVDLEDESEFRMLVDNQHVKYITIDGGLYDVEDMCFEPLRDTKRLRSNVNQVAYPGLATPVVAKFARFEWEIPQLEAETEANGWIQDHKGIAPEFLGHLTEDGRVIGFLMARVSSDWRHATPDDLALCSDVLGKLHKLGIKHGDTNKHNFFIHRNEEGQEVATLIGFDMATRNATEEERAAEMEGLRAQLEDTSGRGGEVIVGSIMD